MTKLALEKNASEASHSKTKKALLWMKLSHEPLVILYALLPFILRKDLQASILQISILSTLRPILPVFSFYWSANLKKKNLLKSNLISAWIFARLPFLFVPWILNSWYLIFCAACYEFFNKSGNPALIEILKRNIPREKQGNIYTFYFVLSFLESILLGFAIINILSWDPSLWAFLFGLSSFLGLMCLFFQFSIPILDLEQESIQTTPIRRSFKDRVFTPWKESFSLLKSHPEFAKFQYGFMIGGFSLMLISPSLSVYYADVLHLPHASVITGRSICMGIGIVLSSWIWKRHLQKEKVLFLTQLILTGFTVYLLFMVFTKFYLSWFYLSFFLYGVAQAGSHVLWNLSGILFSKDQDSAPFSRANILMVGIRGAIAPALGGMLCHFWGPELVIILGVVICFLGIPTVYGTSKRYKAASFP